MSNGFRFEVQKQKMVENDIIFDKSISIQLN